MMLRTCADVSLPSQSLPVVVLTCADVSLPSQALPDVDLPSVFSLPANIDRSAQQTNSQNVINQLKQMSVATVRGWPESRGHRRCRVYV